MDLIICLLIVIIPALAQLFISINYSKYKRIFNESKITGQEVARKILDSNNLEKIYVVATGGNLTDHYDSSRKVIRLSKDIYDNESIASLAVAAHECGHAIQDKDGYFFITGRKKNVIVLKNGKNIYPEELETLVGKLPYVDECMVFGYPKDDDLVVSVKIVYNKDYVKDNFAGFTQEQLKEKIWEDIKEINSGLTNYKHMKKIIITDEPMIKTSTAKIKRHEEMSKILAEEGAIK